MTYISLRTIVGGAHTNGSLGITCIYMNLRMTRSGRRGYIRRDQQVNHIE